MIRIEYMHRIDIYLFSAAPILLFCLWFVHKRDWDGWSGDANLNS